MTNTTFPKAYSIEWPTELPNCGSPHFFYPGASSVGGHDGFLVKIRPENGQAWLGTFAFGDGGFSGIFSTPDPQRICVVSRGAGYFVNVTQPSKWEGVRASPIMDVRSVLAHEIVVFSDWTDLIAYGATGMKWQTDRLAWDSLKITDVSDTHITGTFFNLGETKDFVVDLQTGEHEGGISAR